MRMGFVFIYATQKSVSTDNITNALRVKALTTIANNGVKYCIPLYLDKYLEFSYILQLGYNYYESSILYNVTALALLL